MTLDQSIDNPVDEYRQTDDNAAKFVALSVLQGLSTILLIGPLGYLYVAARYRIATIPRVARILIIAGPILYAVPLMVLQVLDIGNMRDVLAQLPLSPDGARDLLDEERRNGTFVTLSIVGFAGRFAVGAAFILTSMYARRAGLLSSFMGILGIIVGVLFVLPIFGPLPVVQFFWVAAIGVLVLGRWPTERGPAWDSGEAEPWPTAAQLRAEAEAGSEESKSRRRGEPEPEPDEDDVYEEDDTEAAPAHPRSKKRKRKRRR